MKSGLDDNNPFPKFSIRDYVLSTRAKDIKNNWPFSQKNLQLCLKYGVKDVLPPFQSLDSVKDPSIVKCAGQNSSYSDVKLSELSDPSIGRNLPVNSSGSEEDKEFPSTTTTQSCSDINSIPPLKSPTEKPESAVRASNKVESNIQNTVKKSRLVVKLNNIAEQKSNEDLAFDTSVISETMASKVCPVCKTFSSSSNTTLNAHIDQCLSGESTVKWTTNSKVIKHRIKPRKTRLMVDIYETALHGTLEDLDRRNGTNWASNLGFPAQDLEACAVEKNKPCSSVNIEDINEDGAVYIDSNGTKLRILSKLSDLPSNANASYDCGPSKLVKTDQGNKFLSSKKKKYLVQKQKLLNHCLYGQGSYSPRSDRLLRCPPDGQKSCYSRPDYCPEPEVNNDQHKRPEGYQDLTQPVMACDPMKPNDLGMIKQWVGSKRTGLRKKINPEHENQPPDKNMRKSKVKSHGSSVGDTLVKRSSASKSLIPSDENPLLTTESHKRKENLSFNPHDGFIEQPCQRKRPGFSFLKSQYCRDKNNHLVFPKFNVKQSSNDSPSVHEHDMDPPNDVENHVSSRNDEKMRINLHPDVNNDSSFISSRMSQHHTFSSDGKEFSSLGKTSLGHAISSGSKKFSSLRKKLLSVRDASVSESKKKLRRKHLDFKKRRLYCKSGSEPEAAVSRTAIENEAQMEKASGKPLINRTRFLKIQKKRGGFVNTGKGDLTLKDSDTSPKSDNHGVRKNIDSFMGLNVPVETYNVPEEVEIQDELVCEPTYKNGEAFIAFSKSFDSAFPAYEGHCQAELVLGDEQEMFCSDKVGENLVTQNSHVVAEMDAGEAQRNYYVEVDPIPIPGPPGSFLPSPGRMGSEELQGNSSLTTCRLQSSEDEHEVVDMDSSDSRISAVSVVSNSVTPRSESLSVVNFSVQSHVRHETQCDIKSETLPEKERTTESEKNAANSSMGYYAPARVSNNSSEAMFQACCDCESPTPSTSNPVLRLMGKNLMVVNKDENRSPQTRLTQSIQNERHSFHHISSGGPSIIDNTQTSMSAQHYDFNSSSDGFKIPHNFRPVQFSAHPLTVMFPSKGFGGNFTSSLRPHEYAGGCNLIRNQLDTQTTYDFEKVRAPIPLRRTADNSSGSKHKEIIVIDDSPESEAPMELHCESRRVNPPFYSYQSRVYHPICAGYPMFQNGNTQVPPSKGMNGNLGQWNCTAQGPSVLHPNSLNSSLPSTAHLRSPLYFSPGFS
ncbi:hypothetical protein DH2020_017003 [Rehmannia glutinosa]|uniref:Uncharacterized protein n=1 Tax=Rehmannia glutinosa TaxID=99300 RepID=A0ABR0WRE5_REHGL